jgi:hypothetical protein
MVSAVPMAAPDLRPDGLETLPTTSLLLETKKGGSCCPAARHARLVYGRSESER